MMLYRKRFHKLEHTDNIGEGGNTFISFEKTASTYIVYPHVPNYVQKCVQITKMSVNFNKVWMWKMNELLKFS